MTGSCKNLGVSAPQQINQLRYRFSIHLYAFHAAKGDISIGLDRHSLIELGVKGKLSSEDPMNAIDSGFCGGLQHRCLSVFSPVAGFRPRLWLVEREELRGLPPAPRRDNSMMSDKPGN